MFEVPVSLWECPARVKGFIVPQPCPPRQPPAPPLPVPVSQEASASDRARFMERGLALKGLEETREFPTASAIYSGSGGLQVDWELASRLRE
ncbi:hypothetical protein MHYP_G00096440 [Metynnis hypsauchen]